MVWVWLSGQQMVWPADLPALRATAWTLRSGLALPPAQAVPQGPLKVAWLQQAEVSVGQPDAPVLPRAAAESVSVRAAAEPLPGAASVRAAAEPLPGAASVRAAAEPLPGAASVHVAAEPRPEAASVPWVQQAAAEEEPDESRAAAPEAAALGVTAQQPAEVVRADAAGQPPAAVRPAP
jgi:hypothetical protein